MLQSTSRVDKIATALQKQIARGELRPGDRLPSERSLCAAFGVGRTTIREALKSLAVRGVVGRRGRGAVVGDPENVLPQGVDLAGLAVQVNIKQLYEVRKLIEVQIAGWAAARATPKEIKAMRRAFEEPSSGRTSGSPHRAFHDAVASAVHNPALVQIYRFGSNLFFRLPFFWKLLDEGEIKAIRAQRHDMARRWHEHILAAIAERDVAEAEGAMFQHLDIMEKDLLSRLQMRDDNHGDQAFHSHPMLTVLRASNKEPFAQGALRAESS